ncbi:MAG: site-2 protease family protein, partial [Patescibacteria group bacterium]|nr:site-2 protease family protein [Patescibacteria group bacterium]
AVDRQPPGDPMTLPERLRKRAGETVTLTLERKDEASRDVQVVLGPVSGAAASPSTDSPLDVPAIGAAYQVHPTVAEVVPNSPAAKAGLRAGDTIQKAVITPPENLTPEQQRVGQPMVTVEFELKQGEWPLLFRWLQRWLQGEQEPPALKPAWPVFFHLLQESLPGSTVTLTTGNGGDIVLEPIMADGRYLADRGLLFEPPYCHYKARSFGEALSLGGKETAASAGQVYLFLRRIGTQISFRQLGGPITIARAAGHYAYQGFPQFLIFMTLLSANLAVINFLPIPVLDGGHMIFLAYEGIRRKPADERIQIALTYIGLLFILTLMIWVIGLDIGLFARN